jgi:hypothetical protein
LFKGIFRVPANATEVKEVKEKIDQGFNTPGKNFVCFVYFFFIVCSYCFCMCLMLSYFVFIIIIAFFACLLLCSVCLFFLVCFCLFVFVWADVFLFFRNDCFLLFQRTHHLCFVEIMVRKQKIITNKNKFKAKIRKNQMKIKI